MNIEFEILGNHHTTSSNLLNGSVSGSTHHNHHHHNIDLDDELDQLNDLNTYKNTAANSNTSNWTPSSAATTVSSATSGLMASDSSSSGTGSARNKQTSDLSGRLLGDTTSTDYGHDYDISSRLSLRKRDSSLDNRPYRKPDTTRFKSNSIILLIISLILFR